METYVINMLWHSGVAHSSHRPQDHWLQFQYGTPMASLIWYVIMDIFKAIYPENISLLHVLRTSVSHMGHLPMLCDGNIFSMWGDFSRQVMLDWWDSIYLHLLVSGIIVPTMSAIYEALVENPVVIIFGPHYSRYSGTEVVWVWYAVYVPTPLLTILLVDELTAVQAHTWLHGSISNLSLKNLYTGLIYCMCVGLVQSNPGHSHHWLYHHL